MATFGNIETDVEPLATLIREHTEIHGIVTEAREATEEALAAPNDTSRAVAALEQLRDLDAYLQEDLVIHIAKEEDVLFPALRGIAADIDQVVDEMVEQHDEVRDRQAILERALAALEHSHEDVDAARERLTNGLAAAANGTTPETLGELLDSVKRLDWILQGHFGDEEDDLFVPALTLLSPETFARLAEEAKALEV